jgi:hypothetical protein
MYRNKIRIAVSLCLAFGLVGLMPLRAAAWGRDGHQIVAGIALWRLQQLKAKNALKNIAAILKATPETPLPSQPHDLFAAAAWPDDVREEPEYAFAANLHFVSIPRDGNSFDAAHQCKPSAKVPEGVCIIGALQHYSKVLATSHSKRERLEALSFIVHFMGDLHQPLHTSEDWDFLNYQGKKGDRGGNYRFLFYLSDDAFNSDDEDSCLTKPDVCTERFGEERSNLKLHAAWDKYLIRTEMKNNPKRSPDFKAYGKDLLSHLPAMPSDPSYASMEEGDFIKWAEQTHQVARMSAYGVIGPKSKISAADNEQYDFYLLNEAYRVKNTRIIDDQLVRAGIRLAVVLRKIFPDA